MYYIMFLISLIAASVSANSGRYGWAVFNGLLCAYWVMRIFQEES